MTAPAPPSFPLFLYLYDEHSRYGAPREIADEAELAVAMEIIVGDHIGRKLEVRITDLAEELVLHSQKGKVLWPAE